jgi:sterol-4alpha-carboxylate 3-dehydrogenase (decarboxylating)
MTNNFVENSPVDILVTGSSGFLGRRIVEELLSADSLFPKGKIKVFDCVPYAGISHERLELIQKDIRDAKAVEQACMDIQIVIHCAAVIDWGLMSEKEVLDVNVGGTQNIIAACKKHHVKHLVYTSSLDAVFTGRPLIDIDETQPYPKQARTIYCKSKEEAEVAVLDACDKNLNASILRPSDIYGEADPYHIDSLIDMAKTGFYVRLGNGQSKCQHVYVGNMAFAHIRLAYELYKGNEKVHKQIYFITDGEAYNFFKFFDKIVSGAGYKIFPRNLWLPKGIAYSIAGITELMTFLLRPVKRVIPKFSRFAVIYTCTDFTFSSKKALDDFGYTPKYTINEALDRTIAYYRERKN